MPQRLLLVENHADNICLALAGVFQQHGFETELATTLAGCLESASSKTIDVVLMITNNIRNPPAFEIAQAIRRLQPNCGFVFLAGQDHDGREPFLAAGYEFQVYPCPMPIPDLLALVSKASADPVNTFRYPARTSQ